jgi:hypothetical protein
MLAMSVAVVTKMLDATAGSVPSFQAVGFLIIDDQHVGRENLR